MTSAQINFENCTRAASQKRRRYVQQRLELGLELCVLNVENVTWCNRII